MPMNEVDQMLSDAADVVENRLKDDAVTRSMTEALLTSGQTPTVVRELPVVNGFVAISIQKK